MQQGFKVCTQGIIPGIFGSKSVVFPDIIRNVFSNDIGNLTVDFQYLCSSSIGIHLCIIPCSIERSRLEQLHQVFTGMAQVLQEYAALICGQVEG
ncbi:hypothetical protein D3C72_508620 [compost metagenome]